MTSAALDILIVTGSRHGCTPAQLKALHEQITQADVVVHGNAGGVDEEADRIAYELGRDIIRIPALWLSRKRSAGPRRNDMVAVVARAFRSDGHRVHYLACPADDSSGTWNCVSKLKAIEIPGEVVP